MCIFKCKLPYCEQCIQPLSLAFSHVNANDHNSHSLKTNIYFRKDIIYIAYIKPLIHHFQARCRGWLGRQKFQTMQVQDAAAVVIQDNVLAYLELRDWSWWKLYLKVRDND